MSDEKITPEQVEMLESAFLNARLGLILERLAQSDCTLGNFEATLAALMKEYSIGSEELETVKNSANFDAPLPDEAFLPACIAALMLESSRLMEFIPQGVEQINRLALHQSAEQHRNAMFDPAILADTATRTGASMSTLRELANQQAKDPNSTLWEGFKERMKNFDPQWNFLRGDRTRGVFQYCDATDYEYALSMFMGEDMDEEAPVFDRMASCFVNMEKDELTDGYVEQMCRIMPKFYMYSDELVGLHRDTDKAVDIYEDALKARPSTTPANPRFTADVFPGVIKTAEMLEQERQAAAEAAQKAAEEAEAARAEFAEKIKKFDGIRLIALIASAVLLVLMLTVWRALYVLPFMITMVVINAVNTYFYVRSRGPKHPLSIISIILTILYFVI